PPFKTTTMRFILAGCALSFASYVVWRGRQKRSLDQAAVSIDQRAGLNDEMKTALWFIRNPHTSKWVDRQIQRAARNTEKIDVGRAYPIVIPRTSYAAVAMIAVFLGLNFAPLPGTNPNHPAPGTAAEQTPQTNAREFRRVENTSNGSRLD